MIVFFYNKTNVKKFSHNIQGRTFQFSSTGRESHAFMIYWQDLNCLVKSPASRMLIRKFPTFTSVLIISRYDIFFIYARAVCIHSKYLKKGSFGKSIYRQSKTSSEMKFFLFLHLIAGVVSCEQLKMRKKCILSLVLLA